MKSTVYNVTVLPLVSSVILGGLKDHLKEVKRCRRLIMIGCGTSFHAAVAVSIAVRNYSCVKYIKIKSAESIKLLFVLRVVTMTTFV